MADLKSLCEEFKLNTNLSFDIRYADDTTIMSTMLEKLQLSTEELQAARRKLGTKIKNLKNSRLWESLGRIVPSTERDVSRHIALVLAAFDRLRNCMFFNRNISTRLKARLYGALILPIAIYGAEAWSWMLRSQEKQSLEVFKMR